MTDSPSILVELLTAEVDCGRRGKIPLGTLLARPVDDWTADALAMSGVGLRSGGLFVHVGMVARWLLPSRRPAEIRQALLTAAGGTRTRRRFGGQFLRGIIVGRGCLNIGPAKESVAATSDTVLLFREEKTIITPVVESD